MKICIISIIIFLIGLYYICFNNTNYIESFDSAAVEKSCPDVLIQKDKELHLFNSKKAKIPGINPIIFHNLEEYVEFLEWQRSQGIYCNVLYLRQSYDAQGTEVYAMRPSPTDQQGGLNYLPQEMADPSKSKLIDANRSDPPYNTNSYPGFDQDNQYIGLETPLDNITNSKANTISPNPMDSNWGGNAYTQKLIDKGVYKENEVKIAV